MTGSAQFGLIVAVIGLAGSAAVLANRLSVRLRVPAPASTPRSRRWPRSPRSPCWA
jgi:hypothetical protein